MKVREDQIIVFTGEKKIMEYKDQLNEAEKALWTVFNIVERTRKNKALEEIRQIVTSYLDAKINNKTKDRGQEKG